jgi:hypothetical protein
MCASRGAESIWRCRLFLGRFSTDFTPYANARGELRRVISQEFLASARLFWDARRDISAGGRFPTWWDMRIFNDLQDDPSAPV